MRCPSCGTDNAPGSRFCGGCGAKLAVSARLAPTQKITDDAGYPQPPAPPIMPATVPGVGSPRPQTPTPYVPGGPPAQAPRLPQSAPRPQRSSGPPPYPGPAMTPSPGPGGPAPGGPAPGMVPSAPRSHPPGTAPPPGAIPAGPRSQAPGTMPPANGAARSRAVQHDDPASSLPTIARRPWRLIVVVLIIDLALAGAGGWMLSVGLAAPPRVEGAPAEPPVAGSAPATRPAGATSPASATGSTGAAPARAATPVASDAGVTSDAGSAADAGAAVDARVRDAGKGPIDPYDVQPSDPLPPETK